MSKPFLLSEYWTILVWINILETELLHAWKQNILLHCLAQCLEPKSRHWRPNSCCHTWFHLGFSVKLRIWQLSACKMEPRSSYIFCQEPVSHPPTKCLRACISVYTGYHMIYHIIFKGFTLKKCMKSAAIGQCQSLTKFVSIHTNFKFTHWAFLGGFLTYS